MPQEISNACSIILIICKQAFLIEVVDVMSTAIDPNLFTHNVVFLQVQGLLSIASIKRMRRFSFVL